jgi:RHS repeat-associated protein
VRQDQFGVVDQTLYSYNNDGAVTGREVRTGTGTLLSEDHLSYSYRDLTRKYVFGSMTSNQRKDWRYRYSAGGQREGKRMYFNQGTDTAGRVHPWAYYLLGAGDEQLAIYHGQQTRDSLCGDGGRRVYVYPAEYHTRGTDDLTNIITRPSGEKQYVITDHLGSQRSMYSSMGAIIGRHDFDPFGAPLSLSTGHNSYIDHERDGESGLFDFGVRKYDPITGRFLSTDALMLAYPGESPYGYGGNNPLVYKDPSGLYMVRRANPLNPGEYEWEDVSAFVRMPGFQGSGVEGGGPRVNYKDWSGGTAPGGGGSGYVGPGPGPAPAPDVTQLPGPRVVPIAIAGAAIAPEIIAGGVAIIAGAAAAANADEVAGALEDFVGWMEGAAADVGGWISGLFSSDEEALVEVGAVTTLWATVNSENDGGEAPPPALDGTGKVHGDIPSHIPDNWTKGELEQLGADLEKSIRTRQNEQKRLGEDGPHRERLRQEQRLLRQIRKKLSGS